MNTRRLTTTGVAIIAALSLGVTGCGPTNDTQTPGGSAAVTSAPPTDAREELAEAARKLSTDTVRMDLKMSGLTGSAVMDPQAKKGKMTMELGELGDLDVVLLDMDIYLRMPGIPGMSGKWMHLNATQLPAGSSLNIMPDGDPGGASRLLQALVDVERTAEHQFKGTLDLTKSPTAKESVKALGEKVKAVPFTARTDEQGRLIEMALDMSGIQAELGTMTTTYSGFGTPVSVEKPPASQTQEAPPELLKSFGV